MDPTLRKRLFGQVCLATKARFVARELTRLYDGALRPFGITVAQLNLLVVLLELRDVRQSDLADATGIDQSSLSRNLRRLRAAKLIREAPGQASRGRRLVLTARGSSVVEAAVPAWEAAQEDARALLGRDGVKWLVSSRRALGRW